MTSRPPLPPFTAETAAQKARMAEDAWNSRDPERVALAYTQDSLWRNRSEFFQVRAAIVAFLTRFLRARAVDVVHTHRAADNVLGSIAARLAGVPHVVRTVHGLTEPMRGWARAPSHALTSRGMRTASPPVAPPPGC